MFVQFALLSLSLIAVSLSQCERESMRRWACIFGLLSQPFWFVATFEAGQWGMFALAFCYTLAWLRGFYHHWLSMTTPYRRDES